MAFRAWAAGAVWLLCGGPAEAGTPARDLVAARDAVTGWLRHRPGGAVYVDQYSREKDGRIAAAFREYAAPAQVRLVVLLLAEEGGRMRVVREDRKPPAAAAQVVVPLGTGKLQVTELFPAGFAQAVTLDGGRCDRRGRCPCRLLLGGGPAISLGSFSNHPEGEWTGDEEATLRVVPLLSFGAAAGWVMAVVENRVKDGPVIERRGTLLGQGPGRAPLWTGELMAPGADAAPCRLSVLAESAAAQPTLLPGCAAAPR